MKPYHFSVDSKKYLSREYHTLSPPELMVTQALVKLNLKKGSKLLNFNSTWNKYSRSECVEGRT